MRLTRLRLRRRASQSFIAWHFGNRRLRAIRIALALWLGVAAPVLAGEAILDAATGRLIAGADANKPRYPASTTKLMTIFVALEAAARGEVNLSDEIRISRHAAAAPPVKLGLKAGDAIRLSDAIHAALILSSNDAARVIAEAVSGSEAAFAKRMTMTANALGMTNTVFRNASGLPDDRHISTAADIGRLILHLDQRYGAFLRPLFRQTLNWRGNARRPRNGTVASVPGAKLGKTGFTCAAGYTAAVLIDTVGGARAIATLANSGPGPRAASLRRLKQGEVRSHSFSPPCSGAKTPKPRSKPVASLGDWSLTLGVFSKKPAAAKVLRKSLDIAPDAPRLIATRRTREGFYAMMNAASLDQAQQFKNQLAAAGIPANLIDKAGKEALGLTAYSGF